MENEVVAVIKPGAKDVTGTKLPKYIIGDYRPYYVIRSGGKTVTLRVGDFALTYRRRDILKII